MRRIRDRFMRNMSLQTKVTIPVFVSVFIILGLTTFLHLQNLSKVIVEQYKERTVAYVRSFDNFGYSLEDYEGSTRLQANIENLFKSSDDLYRIAIYSFREGKPIRVASTVRELIGQEADGYDVEPILTDQAHSFERRKDGENVIEILAPLHLDGAPVASIGIYFRLADRDSDIASAGLYSAAVGIGGGILLLVVLRFVINKSLLRPVLALVTATRELGAGRLDRRLMIPRGDELGKLAQEFNLMAEALELKEKENSALLQELEAGYIYAQEQAGTDVLTGLDNHRTFQIRLSQEISRAQRVGIDLSLLFLDLDHFKLVNDRWGHRCGDAVLQHFGSILKTYTRTMDIVARYGGEEFVILLPETGIETALEVAERLRLAVVEFPFREHIPGLGEQAGPISVSIGVASYPMHAGDGEELIGKADQAMYIAKRCGRNQVSVYENNTSAAGRQESSAISQNTLGSRQGMDEVLMSTVRSLVAVVEMRDHYTGDHSEAVSKYAVAIANALGCSKEQVWEVGIAGLLHDIGKVGIPDQILTKPGPLNEEEWREMRLHPTLGKAIVEQISSLGCLIPLIEFHQERFDGDGYPAGLAGQEIPLGARILAVADSYHAMTTERPYKKAMSSAEAIEEIKRCMGRQFDPNVAAVFIEILESGRLDEQVPLSALI